MPYMAPTRVLTLGRLGRVQPSLRQGYLNPPRTTPSFPQNLLRQTVLSGLGKVGMLAGLGQPPGLATPDQLAASAAYSAYNHVEAPYPGQSVPTQPAPVGQPLVEQGVVQASNGNNVASQVASWGWGGYQYNRGAVLGYLSLSLLSGIVSAVHGWQRDRTPIAAWGWFTLGSMFPIVTPGVALVQGYGKRRGRARF